MIFTALLVTMSWFTEDNNYVLELLRQQNFSFSEDINFAQFNTNIMFPSPNGQCKDQANNLGSVEGTELVDQSQGGTAPVDQNQGGTELVDQNQTRGESGMMSNRPSNDQNQELSTVGRNELINRCFLCNCVY